MIDILGDFVVWFTASKVPTKIAVWIMALAFAGILVAATFVLVSKLGYGTRRDRSSANEIS
jgi:hypothetical protein